VPVGLHRPGAEVWENECSDEQNDVANGNDAIAATYA
jgi:hypothetical protein